MSKDICSEQFVRLFLGYFSTLLLHTTELMFPIGGFISDITIPVRRETRVYGTLCLWLGIAWRNTAVTIVLYPNPHMGIRS